MTATPSTILDALRGAVLAGDNGAAFGERERVLADLAAEASTVPAARRYTFVFRQLLARLSCPVHPADRIVGRLVEERLPDDWVWPRIPHGLASVGHMTPDYPLLLRHGLSGIVALAMGQARAHGDSDSIVFCHDLQACCLAVCDFAARYAAAARAAGNEVAARALEQVPRGPARTLPEALQSIWLIHLVLSGVCGSRDFAFGRLDQTLLPYYRADVAAGRLESETATDWLAHFFMKTNEITGTGTWNYRPKPIPCQASKQYLLLGGRLPDGTDGANELSELMLSAAARVRLPEPVLTVRLHAAGTPAWREHTARAAAELGSQVHFYNDDLVIPALEQLGLPSRLAADYGMIGCCRVDIPGRMQGLYAYHYHNAAAWLMRALEVPGVADMDGVLAALHEVARAELQGVADRVAANRQGQVEAFHFESAFMPDCLANARDYGRGGTRLRKQGHFFGGIATVADSLVAIDHLVFRGGRLTLPEFRAIVAADFAGHEALRREIRERLPHFGNDEPAADAFAHRAAATLLDALAAIDSPDLLLPGFYSLDCHHQWGRDLGATPDGRLAGEPVSENQSPVYGRDRRGVTALLRSVARLPLARTVMGGLNVRFSGKATAATLGSLVRGYFATGGLHVGFTCVSREELEAAQRHPDAHRSLCVRLYGFSEYFVSLSPDEQQEILDRTAY